MAIDQDDLDAAQWQPSTGYIDKLEVCNFKSYRGKQNIGPFRNFTAVVGPNGSGKSNLMDAISFVLGVRTAHLRGSLSELLYKNMEGDTEADNPSSGYVKLVFFCEDENRAVTFARHIQSSGGADREPTFSSVYKVDEKAITWEAYCQRLSSFGILVKVRNFLVFQGDIEAVAQKSPQGLTQLIEQISGSEAYKQRYEELQKEVGKADEKVSIAVSRRKAIAAERKQRKDQKDEAERYLAKQQELRGLHLDKLLFSLFQLRAQRDAAIKDRDAHKQKAEEAADQHANFESGLEDLKRQVAVPGKTKLLAEKKIKDLQGKKDKKAPELQRAREAVKRLTRTINQQEDEIKELQGKADKVAATVAELEGKLKDLDRERTKLEREVKSHYDKYSKAAGNKLGEANIQAQYEAVKAQVVEQTAKLEGERDALMAQIKAEQDALKQLKDSQDAYQARADALRQQAEEAGSRAVEASEAAAAAKKELKAKQDAKTKAEDELRSNTAQREFKERELSKTESELRECRLMKESKREQRMSEAVKKLKEMYPNGVYGRLFDLGKETRRDYRLPLAVAMGRNIDSVFVDTERTARDCIQFLKDNQVSPMTFVPLTTIRVHPINERLRTGLGGTAKLAVDLVELFQPEFQKAFQFAFDNTIVCDSVDEARNLAYGGTDRHKVVSKDGTQFNRAGLITGGDASTLINRTGLWDQNKVDALRKKSAQLTEELQLIDFLRVPVMPLPQSLPTASQLREKVASLTQECSELEAKMQYKNAEAKAAKERCSTASRDASAAEKSARDMQAEVNNKQQTVDKLAAEEQGLAKRIHDIADRLFAPLSKALGVQNIRAYEEEHATFEAETARKRAQLDTRESRCKNQLEFEKSRVKDNSAAVKKRQQQLEQDKAKLEELEVKLTSAMESINELTKQIEKEKEACASAETQIKKAQADLAEYRKRGQNLASEMAKLARLQGQAESVIKSAETTAKDQVAAAGVEGFTVPRLAGAAALQGVAEAMDDDEDGDGDARRSTRSTQPTSDAGAGGQRDSSILDSIDFSSLPANLRRQYNKKDVEAASRGLQNRVDELKQELESSTPNLKAPEQYEAVKEKEKELTAVLDQAKKEQEDLQKQFHRCQHARDAAFNAAFEHISAAIDMIYKELTRSSVHPLGGTAYLSLERTDEPYLAGIKYTAMPPTKRFRDMEQLSGGEKTVAALALLFAIHSFRPSPFFVLDEVDAALDATNVARVAHYIRDKTRKGRDAGDQETASFQSIVISLKDIFYEKADALVGVARDIDQSCSRTFTFELEAFGEPLPAES